LASDGEATASALAASAGFAYCTVAHALVRLERDGKARRRDGGYQDGRRLPAVWVIAAEGQIAGGEQFADEL
jgi:hypothetical protein